jgi:hypothetical protein
VSEEVSGRGETRGIAKRSSSVRNNIVASIRISYFASEVDIRSVVNTTSASALLDATGRSTTAPYY